MLADCWLVGVSVFFTAKWRLNNWRAFFLAVDWLHGWRLPSLLSWSVVGWLVLAKRLRECWLTVDWWVARCFLLPNWAKKNHFFLAVDWLHGWRLPSLLSWSVVGWLVLAKRLTECWLAVGWWVARCFFTGKFRLKNWRGFFWQLTDYMAGGSPLCLAGRWSFDWFWQRDWQNIGWLLVGGWLSVFLLQNSHNETDGYFLAVDWQHGWWLPSLLSWLVVGWLVLAKGLTECWLAVGWWVARCFFTAKFRLKNWRFFFEQLSDYMAGGSPLCLAGRWSVEWLWQRDCQNVGWLLIGGWLGVFYCKMETWKLTGFF